MSNPSPPKPWERASGQTTSALPTQTTAGVTASADTASPAIPQRPNSLSSVVNRTASNYTGAGGAYNRPYGGTYGGVGGYGSTYGSGIGGYGSSYGSGMGGYGSSPYNRFGSMYGNSMYGGGYSSGLYGGMGGGGMYGGMGGGMYGGGPMGPGDPNDPNNSMTGHFAQSTQATFQIIESIVGAFGGFAQMLESTYMATHSSFFAMVSVAEQFTNLRTTLGSLLGIYTLARYIRTLIARITGRPPPADATSLTPSAFLAWSGEAVPPQLDASGRPVPGTGSPARPSKKPLLMFLLAAVGLPYLMGKLISALARSHEESLRNQGQIGPNGEVVPAQNPQQAGSRQLDPAKLAFARVLYDYPPSSAPGAFAAEIDLEVRRGDHVAVLERAGADGAPNPEEGDTAGQWWRCRARDGRCGWLPAAYLEIVARRPAAALEAGERSQSMPAAVTDAVNGINDGRNSRVNTMTTAAAPSRAATMKAKVPVPVKGNGSPKDLEGFQKAWANER